MKKRIVKSEGGAKTAEGFSLAIRDEADNATYRKALDETNKLALAYGNESSRHAKSSILISWEVGSLWVKFFAEAKSSFGAISNELIKAVCADLEPRSDGQETTMQLMRYFIKLAESYTKDRLVDLIDNHKFNNNHFRVLFQIGDIEYRKKKEQEIIDRKLTGDDLRKDIKKLARTKSGAKKLTDSSRKKHGAVETQKARRLQTQQDKVVNKLLNKAPAFQDELTNLYEALVNLNKSGDADMCAKIKKGLNELMAHLSEISQTCETIKEVAKEVYEPKHKEVTATTVANEKEAPAAAAPAAEAKPMKRKVVRG